MRRSGFFRSAVQRADVATATTAYWLCSIGTTEQVSHPGATALRTRWRPYLSDATVRAADRLAARVHSPDARDHP